MGSVIGTIVYRNSYQIKNWVDLDLMQRRYSMYWTVRKNQLIDWDYMAFKQLKEGVKHEQF